MAKKTFEVQPCRSFCECSGPLVRITCSRSDTSEVLDTACVCPECFSGCTVLQELFSIGVITHDGEGTAYLAGHGPE